ncbi:MAG: cell division protein ZapE [Pseudohongiellaceae bacterium]|nr:cell division protein ZapE [Pseudohongiellaceae bacterium]
MSSNAIKSPENVPPTTQEGPLARYRADIDSGVLSPDEAQLAAVGHFQRLFDELGEGAADGVSGPVAWVKSLFGASKGVTKPVKGLYLYGGVGRGKTYLMDVFFESLPFSAKMRTHFHRFMQRVHAELAQLKQQKNPLELVADKIAQEARVLCFDEFFVSDIGDAMILGGLLEHLIDRGVTLVATSNIEPSGLYENGLQRERFLPAIALLQSRTDIVKLDSATDYRLRSLKQARIYYSPLGEQADAELSKSFNALASEHAEKSSAVSIDVLGRQILARECAEDVIWFDFKHLCGGPRSAYDYIELAKLYHAVILSDVPELDAPKDDMAKRFISMVDEFYDRNVKLIIAAQVPLLELYSGTALAFAFERTTSRLLEMQSEEYLAREHRP